MTVHLLTEELILSRIRDTYCLCALWEGSNSYCPVLPAGHMALATSTCSVMASGCILEKFSCLDADPSSAHLMGMGQLGVGQRTLLLPPSGHLRSLVLPPVQSPSSSRQTASKVRREGTYHKATVFQSAFTFAWCCPRFFEPSDSQLGIAMP